MRTYSACLVLSGGSHRRRWQEQGLSAQCSYLMKVRPLLPTVLVMSGKFPPKLVTAIRTLVNGFTPVVVSGKVESPEQFENLDAASMSRAAASAQSAHRRLRSKLTVGSITVALRTLQFEAKKVCYHK